MSTRGTGWQHTHTHTHTHIHDHFCRLTTASMYFSPASYQSWFIVRVQPYTLRYLQGVSMMCSSWCMVSAGQTRRRPVVNAQVPVSSSISGS